MTASHMGSRLRRLREENGLTQAAFARTLGLSSSYLNQLEKDARPVTSRVLVKISEVYGVDSAFFASDSDTRLIAAVTEALTDTQLSAEVPAAEVVDLVRAHPAGRQVHAAQHAVDRWEDVEEAEQGEHGDGRAAGSAAVGVIAVSG